MVDYCGTRYPHLSDFVKLSALVLKGFNNRNTTEISQLWSNSWNTKSLIGKLNHCF